MEGHWALAKRKYPSEKVIHKLREVDVLLGPPRATLAVVKQLRIMDRTLCRWRKACGGMKIDQAKRLKDLEAENARLRRDAAEFKNDKLILKVVAGRMF